MFGLGSASLDAALDRYLTTPPEEKETKIHCKECNEALYLDDEFYRLDDAVLCRRCALKWLDNHSEYVTEEMAYGE